MRLICGKLAWRVRQPSEQAEAGLGAPLRARGTREPLTDEACGALIRHRMVCRLHTFLFADLAGFTSFTAQHGDERAADLALAFHERVRALAGELGCEVIKGIGDAVMVRGENGNATLELGRRILALAGEGAFPPVRAGVATGPAVQRDGDWFGATVNTASRVAAAALAGELLMTEGTHAASDARAITRGRYRLRGLPDHALFATA